MNIQKVLDNVNWMVMFNMMWKVLYNLYIDELIFVKIKDNVKEAKINKGDRQGFMLPLIIFNAYILETIDKIEDTKLGIKIIGQKISMTT